MKSSIILDAKYRIAHLGDEWDEQLIVDSDALLSENLIGKSYFSFIRGDSTQIALGTVLQTVRIRKQAVERSYRCDSPHEARWCTMHIAPEGTEHMLIEHNIVRTEKCRQTLHPRKARSHISSLLQRCSFCCRFQWDASFVSPSDYSVLSGLALGDMFSLPCHFVVCPDCNSATNYY